MTQYSKSPYRWVISEKYEIIMKPKHITIDSGVLLVVINKFFELTTFQENANVEVSTLAKQFATGLINTVQIFSPE